MEDEEKLPECRRCGKPARGCYNGNCEDCWVKATRSQSEAALQRYKVISMRVFLNRGRLSGKGDI